MSWRITFVKGDLTGRTFGLGEYPVMVGRSRECGIRIPRSAGDVSRHHLVLQVTDRGVELTNSSSQSGATHVGTEVVPSNHRVMLQVGDRIRLGVGKGTVFVLEQGEAKTFEGRNTGELTGATGVPTGTTGAPTGATDVLTGTTGMPTGATDVPTGATGVPTGATVMPTGRSTLGTGGTANSSRRMTGATNPPDSRSVEQPTRSPKTSRTGKDTDVLSEDEDERDRTRQIETVLVDQADIQKLIEELIAARKRKVFWRVFLFVLAFFAVAIAYYLLQPRPEKVLTWPRRDDGEFDVQKIQLETPLGTNALWLSVPGSPDLSSTKGSNGIVTVTTRLGRQRDVPFWITFSCECDKNAVTQSRSTLFEKKKRELAATGSWNFQASTPLAFLGKDNGLPYLGAQYLRSVRNGTETEQRFGHLLFAVWGDCILTVLREIPAVEQWRGGAVMAATPLLNVGQRALENRWEGRPDYRDEPVESMLSEVDALLASKAPMRWQEVEFLLQSVLVKSALQTGEEARKTREKALERLRDLRKMEQREYFRLKGEWQKYHRLGNVEECGNTLNEALKIFAMPEDRRNAFFLRGGWKE